ncbi:hypothetical protein DXK94_08060 [Arthrobacter sp. RT-1]|uniref:hypothetical protein n=1 Tax=Arthrobacter sp. RT-1 TaxID=2292263 RepID=UPI000E1E7F11|nr:hypothetical protein [Arthrobacter sp. RT-1]RDV10477.1 hypothetical protein DXK94_08060 [Arthrobacter sp. RT-1]
MGREVWGVYSVRDHLPTQAWAADVLIYDRLVVPVPSPRGDEEWRRWQDRGWEPERQQRFLSILGEKAYPLEWSDYRQNLWRDLRENDLAKVTAQIEREGHHRRITDAYMQTAMVLTAGLPAKVTAVNAVATYRSADELKAAVQMREVDPEAPVTQGQAVVVIGREFLIPEPGQFGSDEDLLRAAVELSSDSDYRRRRTAYWRWQREFLGEGIFVDPASVTAALEEMQDLVADEQRAIRRGQIRLATLFALCVATAGVGLLAGPLAPATVATAFLSVGQFVAGEALEEVPSNAPSPAGLLISGRRDLGWRG